MGEVFGWSLLVIVVTICAICAIGILTRIILDEIERYQKKRAAMAAKVITESTRFIAKHFCELLEEVDKTLKKEQTVDQYFDKIDEWNEEDQKDEE